MRWGGGQRLVKISKEMRGPWMSLVAPVCS